MATVTELLRAAHADLRAGQPAAALERAQAALDQAPDDVDAHLLAADALRQQGRAGEAVELLKRLEARLVPRFDLCFNLGVLADAAGDPATAVAAYRRAAALRPAAFEPLHNLGQALTRLGAHAEALEAQARALALAPQHPLLVFAHATALRATGRAREAATALERHLAARPGDARAWNLLGILRRELGTPDGAAAAYRAALAADATLADAWHNLAMLEAARGMFAVAREAAARAVALRPTHPASLLNLAAIELKAGDQAAALASAERALALVPADAGAHLLRAQVLSWSFDRTALADAERAALHALDLGADAAPALSVVCVVARKLGALPQAIDAGRRAVAADPVAPEPALHLADALLEAGAAPEARAVLDALLARVPDAPPAVQRQLGIVTLVAGAPREARAALERAAAVDPSDQRTTAFRIAACQATGDVAAARWLHDMDRFVRPLRPGVPPGFSDEAAFRAALAHDIRHHPSLRFEPVGLAAVGGSLAQDLLSVRTPAIDGFERVLRQAISAYQDALPPDPAHPFLRAIPRRYRLQMWATLLDGGGEIAAHIHEESWLSGAYYVALPGVVRATDAGRAGWIEFGQPALSIPGLTPELRYHQPEEGLLILFPSYLYHRTLPFQQDGGLRISISFDLVPERD